METQAAKIRRLEKEVSDLRKEKKEILEDNRRLQRIVWQLLYPGGIDGK